MAEVVSDPLQSSHHSNDVRSRRRRHVVSDTTDQGLDRDVHHRWEGHVCCVRIRNCVHLQHDIDQVRAAIPQEREREGVVFLVGGARVY